jgi:hypothetical protein
MLLVRLLCCALQAVNLPAKSSVVAL